MAWGGWAARETGRLSSHPAVLSHPAVPGSAGAAVTHFPKGSGAKEAHKAGAAPGHRVGWRRCRGPSTPCTGVQLSHSQAHLVSPSANRSDPEVPALTPQAVSSRLPREAITPPLWGQGWVSGAQLPPHGLGPDVQSPPGGFLSATPAARALSCHCPPLPSPSPGAEQLRPAPRPQPLSQLSLGWGRAAGEQLQAVGWGWAGVSPATAVNSLSAQEEVQGGWRRARPGGMASSSAPPPSHLARPAENGVDPRSKPPPDFKGHPGGGEVGGAAGNTLNSEAAESAPQSPHWRQRPHVLTSFLGSSRPCSHPPTRTPWLSPCPFLQRLHFVPSEGGGEPINTFRTRPGPLGDFLAHPTSACCKLGV
nr:CCR4-NOT transcription complex subunit 3-like [Vicugna pacos]